MNKRCRILCTVPTVLIVSASFLLLLTACGIPTYLDLDDNISWTENTADEDQISYTVSLEGVDPDIVIDNGPGIKFFYTISSSSNENNFNSSTSIPVASRFDTYFKGTSGTGLEWYAGNVTAPGFYLFTSTTSDDPLSLSRPDEYNEDKAHALAGTFEIDGEFCDGPEMDLAISDGDSIDFTFSLTNASDVETSLTLSDGTDTYDLKNYNSDYFPINSFNDLSQLNYASEDKDFFEYLDTASSNLYLHIWASVYGGRGEFSNTYWSDLEYLGSITLVSN